MGHTDARDTRLKESRWGERIPAGMPRHTSRYNDTHLVHELHALRLQRNLNGTCALRKHQPKLHVQQRMERAYSPYLVHESELGLVVQETHDLQSLSFTWRQHVSPWFAGIQAS